MDLIWMVYYMNKNVRYMRRLVEEIKLIIIAMVTLLGVSCTDEWYSTAGTDDTYS